MAQVARHLSTEELQAAYRSTGDATLARHYQVIWLLAQGRRCAEVAVLTSFARRWVEQILERYNAFGPRSLGDRRRGNGTAATVLTPEMLDKLRERLKAPPDDGGVWTSKKVAAFMAGELGRSVSEQRGWEALRAVEWTLQRPRPQHAEGATPEEQAEFKKTRRGGRGGSRTQPRRDNRGLRHRRAPHRAEAHRPAGLGAEGPAPDRSRASPLRVALRHRLRLARHRRELLVPRDRRRQGALRRHPHALRPRGRRPPRPHHPPRPRPRRLAHRAGPGSPRGHPPRLPAALYPRVAASRDPLGAVDEPLANKHFATLADLDAVVAARCVKLGEDPNLIRGQTGFHWWPKRAIPI